jgi:hypothetical protein
VGDSEVRRWEGRQGREAVKREEADQTDTYGGRLEEAQQKLKSSTSKDEVQGIDFRD